MAKENNIIKKSQENEKRFYTVELDVYLPATLKYRVLASTPEEALELSNRAQLLEPPKIRFPIIKKLKARVYLFGTHMLKLTKSLL